MITVIGSGRVGATAAGLMMQHEVDGDISVVDIIEGLPQG